MSPHQAKAEMLVRSSAQSVFDAFVDPGTLARFWLDKASGPLAPGATVQWEFKVPGARETVEVTHFDAPRRLGFNWSDGVHVDMAFTAHPSGATVASVVATGFGTADAAIGATEGFSVVLCDLKTLLESGRSANLVRDKAALIAGAT